MLENTWYSVISPESYSSILWRSWEYKETAAEALKLTSKDMKKLGIVDDVIKEPVNGAHRDHNKVFSSVKKSILKHLEELDKMKAEERIDKRIEAFSKRGVWKSR